jgi:hypothetical protein
VTNTGVASYFTGDGDLPIHIGSNQLTSNGTFDGQIGRVRIFNRPLSEAEVDATVSEWGY